MPEQPNTMEKFGSSVAKKVETKILPEPGRYRVLDVATFFMGNSAVTLNPGTWFTLVIASDEQCLLTFENGTSTVEIYLSPIDVQRAGIKVEKVD